MIWGLLAFNVYCCFSLSLVCGNKNVLWSYHVRLSVCSHVRFHQPLLFSHRTDLEKKVEGGSFESGSPTILTLSQNISFPLVVRARLSTQGFNYCLRFPIFCLARPFLQANPQKCMAVHTAIYFTCFFKLSQNPTLALQRDVEIATAWAAPKYGGVHSLIASSKPRFAAPCLSS